jgi:hypothetical protein
VKLRDGAAHVFVETDGKGGARGVSDAKRGRSGAIVRCGYERDLDGTGGREFGSELIEFEEELVLGFYDGPGATSSDLSCGFCLADGTFGFFGQEGTVALRLSVSLRNGGGYEG